MKLENVKTLDMKDGKITKVEYEGVEYEFVEKDATVGDLVLVKNNYLGGDACSFFKVDEGCLCGDIHFIGDNDCMNTAESDEVDLFKKKNTRLKIGDYAKVVNAFKHVDVDEGDIVEILRDDQSSNPFECVIIFGKSRSECIWAKESELVLVTDSEFEAIRKTKAKYRLESGKKIAKSDERFELRKAMHKRRITQVEAAKHCGCTQSHLSKYFTFECEISKEKLNRLVEFVYSRPELLWKKK